MRVLVICHRTIHKEFTYSVRQDTGQVSKEALVNRKQAFCPDGLVQTVEHALVEVASLVIHSRHDRVWKMGLAMP